MIGSENSTVGSPAPTLVYMIVETEGAIYYNPGGESFQILRENKLRNAAHCTLQRTSSFISIGRGTTSAHEYDRHITV